MNVMAVQYERSGRIQQKTRTRNELVAATRRLLAEGIAAPTVEEAAAAATVSRTTAYRYFPNQRSLLLATHPETQAASLLPPGFTADPQERVTEAVRAFIDLIIDTEQQQRTMLRLSLEQGTDRQQLPLRKGRAIGWFEDALAPLATQLGATGVHQLAIAIRSAVGIEALVWLVDVAGLSRLQAAELMQWSAQSMLESALTRAPALLFSSRVSGAPATGTPRGVWGVAPPHGTERA